MKKIIMLLALVMFTISLVSCQSVVPNYDTTQIGLANVENYDTLKKLYQASNEVIRPRYAFFNALFNPPLVTSDGVVVPESVDTSQNKVANEEVSETNIQVEGVDEGDIVKTDGNRIYKIAYDELIVVELNQGNMTLVLQETLASTNPESEYTYYQDLYLTEQYLVVVGQRYAHFLYDQYGAPFNEDDEKINDLMYFMGLPQTVVFVYDLTTLQKVESVEISGYYLTSRLIEHQLYIISNHGLYLENDTIDPRPNLTTYKGTYIPSYEAIYYEVDTLLESFTVITTITLNDTIDTTMYSYLGSSSWGQIYVSPSTIYFAQTLYTYNEVTFDVTYKGYLTSFMLNQGNVVFGGSLEYEGDIINQFAMDELDNMIRFVTTTGFGDDVVNRLYIYERELTDDGYDYSLLSLLDEGIGEPRERVQSVRFDQTSLTVVTFEITDPLYLIDLSDPKAPVIESALKVSGYGTYQHVWKDNYLLVIGFETNFDGRTIGLKVSFFDYQDRTNMVELGKPIVFLFEDTGYAHSEALFNHKALLISEENGLFGFALNGIVWQNNQYMTQNQYMVFDIDHESDQPLQIKATLTLPETNNYEWIERAIFAYDFFYVIASNQIVSYSMDNDYQQVSVINY
jgi:inhibitor of cysteine peptidase